jgi:transposase-like protein
MGAGRPSEYKPEIIDKLNEYLAFAVPENQEIPTVEGLALRLGISKKTLYNWSEEHEEFLHALEELKMRQKESLTKIGIFGGKEINATIVSLLLKVNHDMIETTRSEVTGKDGKELSPVLVKFINNEDDRDSK